MTDGKKMKIFEKSKIRTHWNAEENEWYFSIHDVVFALTDSKDIKQYIKKMRYRDNELNLKWGTICTPVQMLAKDGKYRAIIATTSKGLLRIIQSIPSPKAEPFKQWLAKVGAERIDETIDPELAFERAMQTYLKKGYSKEWINQRLKSIEIRKELTDEWRKRGIDKGFEFAILTNTDTEAWSDHSVKEYKELKGLKKENLRDNMTNLELVLNMLAEASTTEISKHKQPSGLDENKVIAESGGTVAKKARIEIEEQTGQSVVNSSKVIDTIEENKLNT